MREVRPFTEKSFTASAQYDTEFSGRPIDMIALSFDATISSGGTPYTDGAARLLGRPELIQAEEPLISLPAEDWWQLAAISSGGFDKATGTATVGAFQAALDLEGLMPGAGVNASAAKVFLRGTYGAASQFSSDGSVAVSAANLRPWARSSGRDLSMGSFSRPKFRSIPIDLSSADTDIQHKIDFDQDQTVPFLMVRTYDDSAVNRVDGLIRRIRCDVISGSGGSRELIRATWGQLRHYLVNQAGFGDDDRSNSVGVVAIPLSDPGNARGGGSLTLRKGDSLVLHFDTSSTAELDFTSVTPAANDKCYVSVVGFVPVAGAGDSGPADEVRTARAVSTTPARSSRRRRRRR